MKYSTTPKFKNAVTRTIADFIVEIGLTVICIGIDTETFLPGILVESGRLLVDEAKLTFPGDLLHEAGHLALASDEVRRGLSGEVVLPGAAMEAVEGAAIAWSFAAITYLGLDPEIVFHSGGYRGASESLLLNFSLGVYTGVKGLQDAGLTVSGQKATELRIPPFPHMIKWIRD